MSLETVDQFITTIHIDGMHGRMLRMPAQSPTARRDIMLLYGQHASLERMTGLAEVLTEYGRVTVPDLPGFGGMDSFYDVHKTPSLDNFADYLAEYITQNYDDDTQITLIAMSFSFLIATRMLQRHPELVPRVHMLVSFVGFVHHSDFHVPKPLYWLWYVVASLCENRVGAALWTKILLRPFVIRTVFMLVAKLHPKMKDANAQERKRRIAFEAKLWQINDLPTRMHTLKIMLTADLSHHKVAMPVYHVAVAHDFYFDNKLVEQHMRDVYSDFTLITANVEAHAPTIISTAAEAAPFVPDALRALMRS